MATSLSNSVSAMDRLDDELKRERRNVTHALNKIRRQMDAIWPPDTSLGDLSIDDMIAWNELVPRYNELAEQANLMADKIENLRSERNRKVVEGWPSIKG